MLPEYYQNKLKSLNVDRSSGHPKPHKVCLLLSILGLVESGELTENRIVVTPALKNAFHENFERLRKGNDAENINLPFYHLNGDGIWHFCIKKDMVKVFEELENAPGTPSLKRLFEVIDYAYLDPELFDYFQSSLARPQIRESLLENLEDLSVQFHRWLRAMGKSERTANSYVGAIRGTISDWAADASISQQNLISIQSYSTIHTISEELGRYDVFVERNTVGKQMYSAALKSYQDFLSVTCQAEVTEDIDEIIQDKTLDSTQKAVLVNTRVGQGKFREELIKYWKGCALTGYQSTQFLVASHIKPWRAADDRERLDKYNGILLLPNLDKAFDLGYISFTEKGHILASEFIESPHLLGIKSSMKVNLEDSHQIYMEYHRENVFENALVHEK